MRYLFPGTMKQDEFDQIMSMSGLRSESMRKAIKSYLVDGQEPETAILHCVTQSNFSRDLAKIEALFVSIIKYNEIIGVRRIT